MENAPLFRIEKPRFYRLCDLRDTAPAQPVMVYKLNPDGSKGKLLRVVTPIRFEDMLKKFCPTHIDSEDE